MLLWIKLGLIAALVIGALYWKHVYDSRIRDAAVAACESKHREAKAQLVLDYTTMSGKADQAAKERDDAIRQRDDARRKAQVAHSNVVLPGDLVAHLLLDSPPESDRSGHATAPAKEGAPVPDLPQAFDAADLAKYDDDARLAYDSANADSLDCRMRYDSARAAQLKQGGSP